MMMSVLNWLSGGVIERFLGFMERTEKARLDSMSEERRQAYEDARDRRATAKEVRLATAGFWEMRVLTAAVLFMFVSHLGLIWFDTMWPQPWEVAKFPEPISEYEWQIILSLFGISAVERVSSRIVQAVQGLRK